MFIRCYYLVLRKKVLNIRKANRIEFELSHVEKNLRKAINIKQFNTDASFFRKPLAYLQKASTVLSVEDLHQKSCDTGALQKEFWAIPMNHPSEKNFNVPGHGTKNRHRILPSKKLGRLC